MQDYFGQELEIGDLVILCGSKNPHKITRFTLKMVEVKPLKEKAKAFLYYANNLVNINALKEPVTFWLLKSK